MQFADATARKINNTGFALIDALVAMLLLAVALLTAMAALLRGMHATHEAALTGRAVDLAADYLELRRAQPPGAALDPLLITWNERVSSTLPEGPRDTALALVQPLLASDGTPAP